MFTTGGDREGRCHQQVPFYLLCTISVGTGICKSFYLLIPKDTCPLCHHHLLVWAAHQSSELVLTIKNQDTLRGRPDLDKLAQTSSRSFVLCTLLKVKRAKDQEFSSCFPAPALLLSREMTLTTRKPQYRSRGIGRNGVKTEARMSVLLVLGQMVAVSK